jgi:hypothetical protein
MNSADSMRDLTKSMASYTWAMSVYGVQQMMNLVTPQKAIESFDKVTVASVSEIGSALRETFQVGDRIQRGMVDMMAGSLGMFGLDPGRLMNAGSSLMQRSMGAMQGAAERVSGAAQKAAGSATPGFQTAPPRPGAPTARTTQTATNPPAPAPPSSSPQQPGWGPMPK